MAIDVIMPKMGESITEGTILEWKKSVGDSIDLDETLLEISTDKVDSEVPSPGKGIITELLYKVNDIVEVGNVIARIGSKETTSDQENSKPKDQSIEEKTINDQNLKEKSYHDSTLNAKQNSGNNKIFLSPLVKSIMQKENISIDEINTLKGSGLNSRINKADILNYLSLRGTIVSSDQKLETEPLPHIPEVNNKASFLKNNVMPMGRMRTKIAKHMVESKRTSPHVYSTTEVDVSNLVNIRNEYKNQFYEKHGVKLTYTPMILDACIKAIQDFPLMNASIDGENIINHSNINMGVAVALPDNNLIVPCIKSSEEKNFLGLARSTSDLAQRARENKLIPDEIFGSTFTVTNPGIFGSLFGMAIINQPNVGILSIGSINKKPVVKETEYGDVIVVRSMMYITLGYDHRLIDGAYGTRFLTKVSQLIESLDESILSL